MTFSPLIGTIEYENVLSISDDDSFQIHTKQPPNSCFANIYFGNGLLAWEANLDIQTVFTQQTFVLAKTC